MVYEHRLTGSIGQLRSLMQFDAGWMHDEWYIRFKWRFRGMQIFKDGCSIHIAWWRITQVVEIATMKPEVTVSDGGHKTILELCRRALSGANFSKQPSTVIWTSRNWYSYVLGVAECNDRSGYAPQWTVLSNRKYSSDDWQTKSSFISGTVLARQFQRRCWGRRIQWAQLQCRWLC